MRNKCGKCEYSRIASIVIKIYKQNMINFVLVYSFNFDSLLHMHLHNQNNNKKQQYNVRVVCKRRKKWQINYLDNVANLEFSI